MGVADLGTCEVSSVVGISSSQLGMHQHIWVQESILCTCVCVCMYAFMYVRVCMYVCMYVRMCVLVHMRLYMYVNAPRSIHPYVHFFVFGVSGIKFLSANRVK